MAVPWSRLEDIAGDAEIDAEAVRDYLRAEIERRRLEAGSDRVLVREPSARERDRVA